MILNLSERIDPGEIIYFIVILGLFSVIGIQEITSRKRDKLFHEITGDLVREFHGLSNQITQLIGVVNFLALSGKHKPNEK